MPYFSTPSPRVKAGSKSRRGRLQSLAAVTSHVLWGEPAMEMLIQEMAASLTRHPSLEGLVVWTSMVGAMIWLPSLVPPVMRGVTSHFCHFGLVGLVGTMALPSLWSGGKGFPTPLPLLELTALGLAAVWAWLERFKARLASPAEKEVGRLLERENHRDLLNAARLALWLTLSVVPAVRWF